ncbi:MAG: hypothetical protein ACMUIU_09970 [bacterium]
MGLGIPIMGIDMSSIVMGIFIMGFGMPIMGSCITIIGRGIIIPGSVIPCKGPPITITSEGITNETGKPIMGYGIIISIIGDMPIPIIGDITLFRDGNMPWLSTKGLLRATMEGAKGAPLIKDIVVPAAGASAFITFMATNGSFIKAKVTGDIPIPKMGDIDIPIEGTAPRAETTGSKGMLIEGPGSPANMP